MATLTYDQLRMYAAAAGLPADLFAAIGMAESSGRTDVVNSIGCVGVWQINQPVHVHAHPTWTKTWLKDPAHNAQAAKVIYDSQGLSAWQAYTDGAYKKYLRGSSGGATATQAMSWKDIPGAGTVQAVGDGVGAVAGEVSRIAQAVGKTANWISDPVNWLRIGYVSIGGLLVLVGVQMVIRNQTVKKLGPLLGDVAQTKTKGLIDSHREAKETQKKAAADAAKRQARVNEAYHKTRARAQARADHRASQPAKKKAPAKKKESGT